MNQSLPGSPSPPTHCTFCPNPISRLSQSVHNHLCDLCAAKELLGEMLALLERTRQANRQ